MVIDHDADRRYVEALERICADARARRELLWLGAQERGDAPAAAALERADPELARRLRRSWVLPEEAGVRDPRQRRHAYASLWSACLAQHMARR